MTKVEILPPEPPACWLAELEKSEAELVAGQIVAGDEVMRELHESIARLEAKRSGATKRRAFPGR